MTKEFKPFSKNDFFATIYKKLGTEFWREIFCRENSNSVRPSFSNLWYNETSFLGLDLLLVGQEEARLGIFRLSRSGTRSSTSRSVRLEEGLDVGLGPKSAQNVDHLGKQNRFSFKIKVVGFDHRDWFDTRVVRVDASLISLKYLHLPIAVAKNVGPTICQELALLDSFQDHSR